MFRIYKCQFLVFYWQHIRPDCGIMWVDCSIPHWIKTFNFEKIITLWKSKIPLHCNKFLRIYLTNHLNLTMNYTVCVENCCKHWFYFVFYIEMFSRNPQKSQDFIIFYPCMLKNIRYLMYILFHYTLTEKSSVYFYQLSIATIIIVYDNDILYKKNKIF